MFLKAIIIILFIGASTEGGVAVSGPPSPMHDTELREPTPADK